MLTEHLRIAQVISIVIIVVSIICIIYRRVRYNPKNSEMFKVIIITNVKEVFM